MHVHFKEFNSVRNFGVELEVSANKTRELIKEVINSHDPTRPVTVTSGLGPSGWAETHSNDFWHVKYDSTCGPLGRGEDYGWEIASYIASGSRDILNISSLADRLAQAGLETNKNCGLHIHAEVKDFDDSCMGALLARWIKIERWLYAACDISRSGNKYCRSLRVRKEERGSLYSAEYPRDFWSSMKPMNFSTHGNAEKKYSLNTVGFAIGQMEPNYNRTTIELRMPECVLDGEHIKNWIFLFLNFVETCSNAVFSPQTSKECENVIEALSFLGIGRSPNGAVQILDNDLYETKVWFLNNLIKKSKSKSIKKDAKEHIEFIT